MIPELLTYLLKANAALLLLMGVYYGLLRRLTFHQTNRSYLLGTLAFSALYPLVDVSGLLAQPGELQNQLVLLPSWPGPAAVPTPAASGPGYRAWLLACYGVGVGLMSLRLLVQGLSLARLHRLSAPAEVAGVPFRCINAPINPFSFWQTIYLNPAQHSAAELPAILQHELVHVRQWHTLDVLLGHLQRIFSWFSPGAWLLLRAIQENLEFITDEAVLQAGRFNAKDYQYSLVRLSTLAPGPALVTPFSFITLKNRIRMMNSRQSSPVQASRYLLVFPLALGLLLSFSASQASTVAPTIDTGAPSASSETPAPISALPPGALAYLVKEYPGHRLIGVSEVRTAEGLRYKAEIAIGRRPVQLLFTEQGQALVAAPLYYLDGQLVAKSVIDKLNPNDIDKMNVLKGEQARAAFGDAAADGVILITTKKNKNSAAVAAFNEKHNITYAPASPETTRITTSTSDGKGLTESELQGRLLIINGKEATAAESKIEPGRVQSVYVLDAKKATEKYGDKGKKGAVIIITK